MTDTQPRKIYFAAALFCGRETWFNATLTQLLEKQGHVVMLPQRDGFEFAELGKNLKGVVPNDEIPQAVQSIIYLLDVGHFLPSAHLVLANLDEPLDDGVLVEVCHARQIGIPVIGFRTDVRTPYGDGSDAFGGAHFFAAYQCDCFFTHHLPFSDHEGSAEVAWEQLETRIAAAIRECRPAIPSPSIEQDLASEMFAGLNGPVNAPQNVPLIVRRYANLRERMQTLRPRLVKRP